MFVPAFGLPPVERPGGFNTVNATGANFRRIIDLSNVDNSVATNAPGQSAQPGSPYYGNTARAPRQRQVLPAAVHARRRGQAGGAHAHDHALSGARRQARARRASRNDLMPMPKYQASSSVVTSCASTAGRAN